jgi:hypothetical protein
MLSRSPCARWGTVGSIASLPRRTIRSLKRRRAAERSDEFSSCSGAGHLPAPVFSTRTQTIPRLGWLYRADHTTRCMAGCPLMGAYLVRFFFGKRTLATTRLSAGAPSIKSAALTPPGTPFGGLAEAIGHPCRSGRADRGDRGLEREAYYLPAGSGAAAEGARQGSGRRGHGGGDRPRVRPDSAIRPFASGYCGGRQKPSAGRHAHIFRPAPQNRS